MITNLYREVGRYGMYEGPEPGTPEYDALSELGQLAADHGMLPGYVEELAHQQLESQT